MLLFTFCNIVYDNDLGERYRAVTSYKYFRTKMFPCIFHIKAFFIDNYYYFSIDFHEILSIKCRNEYSFYSPHNLHIILFLLLLTIWFDSPNIHCDVRNVHFYFNIKCLKQSSQNIWKCWNNYYTFKDGKIKNIV